MEDGDARRNRETKEFAQRRDTAELEPAWKERKGKPKDLVMATVKLTAENFNQTVSDGGIVLIDCWAEWCGACKTFSPVYAEVARRHPEHVFGKLDTQAEPDLVTSLGVQHIPSLLVYREGVLLLNQPGNFDEQALEDIVTQAVSLDMDAVRADIASHEAQEGKEDKSVV